VKVRDLALGLKHLGEDEGVESKLIAAISPDGTTFQIKGFSWDEEGDTVWIEIEEN
jgi:hypothetical protein